MSLVTVLGKHGMLQEKQFDKDDLYQKGVTYRLNGSVVTYENYILGFGAATSRSLRIVVPDFHLQTSVTSVITIL